jgi:ABC-type transport system substrate-binding protein
MRSSTGRVESAYGVPNNKAKEAPYSRVFGVFFNANENPVFAHLEVREALSLAIDRDHIVNNVLGGFATPLMGPVPPGSASILPLPNPATRIRMRRTCSRKQDGYTTARRATWKLAEGKCMTLP